MGNRDQGMHEAGDRYWSLLFGQSIIPPREFSIIVERVGRYTNSRCTRLRAGL